MECLAQRDRGQVSGPDGARGVDEETTSEASKPVTDEVGRKGNKDLVAKVASPSLVEVDGEVLCPDNLSGVKSGESDVGHDGDDHVLLHVELARVEIPCAAESGVLLIGEDCLE